MSNLPYAIEFHDSVIESITQKNESIIVRLSSAYIHKEGKGWSQVAEIHFGNAGSVPEKVEFPAVVYDATLTTSQKIYNNLLELPLSCQGAVNLEIILNSGLAFTIKGNGVSVALFGKPEFIENVSVT